MVYDRPDMPYSGQQGLKHLGAIQDAIRYLYVRAKQTDPGTAHQAVAGHYKAPAASQGNKRKAEEHLPEDLQLFLPSTAQKKGKYFLDLRISLPVDQSKIIAEQIRAEISDTIGHGKSIEVHPIDVGMEAPKEEPLPKEEPPDDASPPSTKKGRQGGQEPQ